ncbi:MAG: hypothetical protein IE933_05585 [Sphingomonadales bacterium]|nr:hypothetical protein [Sphingomonadales bacterium]MBD3773438.1 hypothetical protein [Paracoccaceae bacterium]
MNLPSIDLSSLPDLGSLTGTFGSLSDIATAITDDRIIAIMVYLYETLPPTVPGS